MDPNLDRSLGWRWILPSAAKADTTLVGFSSEEAAILLAEVPPRAVAATAGPRLSVFNADVAELQAGAPHLAASDVVALTGRVGNLRGWLRLLHGYGNRRTYGLLPAAQPRLLVPLGNTANARRGLSLHRPGRWIARAGVQCTTALLSLGLPAPGLHRQLWIVARTAEQLLPRGLECTSLASRPGVADLDFALYLGTNRPDRRTVILPLGAGEPDRVLKAAATPAATRLLDREAGALATLASTAVGGRIPRLLQPWQVAASQPLQMEYRRRTRASARALRSGALQFLADLARVGQRQVEIHEWLLATGLAQAELPQHAEAVRQALLQSNFPLQLNYVHGDFTPWNTSWTDAGFFAFDWDASAEDGLTLADAANYVLAPAMLVQQSPCIQTVLQDMLRFGSQLAARIGLAPERVAVQLGAFLLKHAATADSEQARQLLREFAQLIRQATIRRQSLPTSSCR